jgi:hypothetical protein
MNGMDKQRTFEAEYRTYISHLVDVWGGNECRINDCKGHWSKTESDDSVIMLKCDICGHGLIRPTYEGFVKASYQVTFSTVESAKEVIKDCYTRIKNLKRKINDEKMTIQTHRDVIRKAETERRRND